MYIIELAVKLYKKITQRRLPSFQADDVVKEEMINCEHVFVPIDSTKKVLACSKCGLILKVDELPKNKDKNFFKGLDNEN